MNKSESIKNIATALCNFQAEILNPKNTSENPFFNSKYAPLNEILNEVRPLLSKHELSILQSPSGNGSDVIISSLIMHTSGEWIEVEPLTLKADKSTAQAAGSAITYGRRYALSSILGISSEDDDDGNRANGSKHICSDCKKEITATSKKTVEQILAGSLKFYKTELCQSCVSKRFAKQKEDK